MHRNSAENFVKISLCILVWNEREGCEIDVPNLPVERFHEVYAVDGGSTDGTVEYLQSRGISVHRQPVKSLNAAYHHAVTISTGDAVVVLFPKATISPDCVLDIAKSLEKHYELVIASRNIRGGVNEEDGAFLKPRKWGVRLLALAITALWCREGFWMHDVLHGVKGFSIAAFKRMKIAETGVSIDLEMVVRAYRLRLKRMELPVQETPRIAGETHFKIWPTARKLGRFLVDEMRRPIPL